jgi:hypothetical protein
MTGLVAGIGIRAALGGATARLAHIPPKAWLAIGGALALVVGVLWHHHRVNSTIATAKSEQRAVDQRILDQTVDNYRKAAAKATADDAANKVRVEAQQTQISKETSNEYEARIAAARATAQRLRGASATHPGGPAKPPVSGVPIAAGGPDETAGQDGLSGDDALTATEQAIQLDELIKWNKAQHAVDVNGAR